MGYVWEIVLTVYPEITKIPSIILGRRISPVPFPTWDVTFARTSGS